MIFRTMINLFFMLYLEMGVPDAKVFKIVHLVRQRSCCVLAEELCFSCLMYCSTERLVVELHLLVSIMSHEVCVGPLFSCEGQRHTVMLLETGLHGAAAKKSTKQAEVGAVWA